MTDTTTQTRPAHTPGQHPSETPEYWDRLARDEREKAENSYWQTAESKLLHLSNAEEYEATARRLRVTGGAS